MQPFFYGLVAFKDCLAIMNCSQFGFWLKNVPCLL